MLAKYPTPTQILQDYNPKLQSTLFKSGITKGELASKDNIPSLALLANMYNNENVAIKWLHTQIEDLFQYVEQPLGVRAERLDEAARLIYLNYSHMNLAEFILFFAECKLGLYGTFFGTTGPLQLTTMFQKYIALRNASIDAYERRLQREANEASKSTNALAEYKAYCELKQKAQSGDADAKRKLIELRYHKTNIQ